MGKESGVNVEMEQCDNANKEVEGRGSLLRLA